MRTKVKMPKVGETAEVVVVLEWLVAPGDTVAEGDPLVQVETDKVDMEVPSPVAGTIVEIVAPLDAEVAVGEVICTMDVG